MGSTARLNLKRNGWKAQNSVHGSWGIKGRRQYCALQPEVNHRFISHVSPHFSILALSYVMALARRSSYTYAQTQIPLPD